MTDKSKYKNYLVQKGSLVLNGYVYTSAVFTPRVLSEVDLLLSSILC